MMNNKIMIIVMFSILLVVGVSGCTTTQTLSENDSYDINSTIDTYFDSIDQKNNSEVGDNVTFGALGKMNVSAELINNTHAQANVTRTIDIYRITSKDVQDLNDQTSANGTSVTRTGTQINYQTAYLATVQEIWQFILVKKNETWSIVNATRISIKEVEKQT